MMNGETKEMVLLAMEMLASQPPGEATSILVRCDGAQVRVYRSYAPGGALLDGEFVVERV